LTEFTIFGHTHIYTTSPARGDFASDGMHFYIKFHLHRSIVSPLTSKKANLTLFSNSAFCVGAICWGAPNPPIDLSRQWAEVHHILGTCGGDIAA